MITETDASHSYVNMTLTRTSQIRFQLRFTHDMHFSLHSILSMDIHISQK